MTDEQTPTPTTPAAHWLPTGYTPLTPFLCVADGTAAIAFYTEVFGATLITRNDGPDGTVAHAELDLAPGRMQLSDPAPDHHLVPPTGEDASTHSYVLYVPDVDATYAAAVARGATGYGEPATFVTGDRYASLLDPFGHRWAVMTRVEDVDPAEAERRVEAWLAEQGAPTSDA